MAENQKLFGANRRTVRARSLGGGKGVSRRGAIISRAIEAALHVYVRMPPAFQLDVIAGKDDDALYRRFAEVCQGPRD